VCPFQLLHVYVSHLLPYERYENIFECILFNSTFKYLLVTLMLQKQETKSFAPLCAIQSKKFKYINNMNENSVH
jgi:hypothetical protein